MKISWVCNVYFVLSAGRRQADPSIYCRLDYLGMRSGGNFKSQGSEFDENDYIYGKNWVIVV